MSCINRCNTGNIHTWKTFMVTVGKSEQLGNYLDSIKIGLSKNRRPCGRLFL